MTVETGRNNNIPSGNFQIILALLILLTLLFFLTVVRNSIASYYVTMTIGCPLSQKIQISEVVYGSKLRNCYFDKDKAKQIVENKCSGLSCVVKATDSFFDNKNPCPSYTWKMLNITYTCVDGKVHDVQSFKYQFIQKENSCVLRILDNERARNTKILHSSNTQF